MGRALKAMTVVLVGAAGLGPATATAVAGTTASTTPTTKAPTTSAPAPSGSLALYLRDVFSLGKQQVTIPGRTVHVVGVEHPYVPGQRMSMRVYLNGRLVHTYGL